MIPGTRIADEPGSWSGTCITPGRVPELAREAFAHTEGSAQALDEAGHVLGSYDG